MQSYRSEQVAVWGSGACKKFLFAFADVILCIVNKANRTKTISLHYYLPSKKTESDGEFLTIWGTGAHICSRGGPTLPLATWFPRSIWWPPQVQYAGVVGPEGFSYVLHVNHLILAMDWCCYIGQAMLRYPFGSFLLYLHITNTS